MNEAITKKLEEFLTQSAEIGGPSAQEQWFRRVLAFLETAVDSTTSTVFMGFNGDWTQRLAMQRGYLEGLIAKSSAETLEADSGRDRLRVSSALPHIERDSRKVFVVHGHDDAAKESVARFLERLNLIPIVLHEQPNAGRTIIEKFETYAHDVAFAVVLLTPDDVGATASDSANLKKRARQNVILELGYFVGKLGRERVCALHKPSVELPSDYQGVVYLELDPNGAWKAKLAQELVQSKIRIDLTGLLGA